MITGNTERDEFKSDAYERLASGHVAKIPGMDSSHFKENSVQRHLASTHCSSLTLPMTFYLIQIFSLNDKVWNLLYRTY